MGKVTGFLEIDRAERAYEPVAERIQNYKEFVIPLGDEGTRKQAARCMDCGIPFCHTGCPVNNQIPDWNDLVYHADWRRALVNLQSTNNFPEITGRICPAPCEESCTLNIQDTPVAIKTIEAAIADRGFDQGWIVPDVPKRKTGRRVAIVGSGPAGLAAAQQLARAGHDVHVFEKNANAGGLMRYGIPDFKMEKIHVQRRVEQMEAEGVTFHYNEHIGVTRMGAELVRDFDAVILAGGAEKGRDLPIPGRELDGVHFAMEFLPQQNRRVGEEPLRTNKEILATGRHVVVIGGGDTGSDCIGTSIRQGALSVTQLEIMPSPPVKPNKGLIWPDYPMRFRTSSSQAEGAEREFAVTSVSFAGVDGKVTGLNCARVGKDFKPIPGTGFQLPADLVLLAMGFVSPVHEGLLDELRTEFDPRGNVKANDLAYQSSVAKVFACGDMRRGQSLVVWAIREGRQAAHSVDKFLMGETTLPR